MTLTSVPTREFERRIEEVREKLAATEADALCLFSGTNVEWLSGFYHLQTERPVCLAVTDEAVAITVPRLERDRATDEAFPLIEEVYGYYDYPGGTNEGTEYPYHSATTPEETIAKMLGDLGVEAVVADANGAPGYWGYSGPPLEEFAGVDVETVEWIEDLRTVKSDVEVELLRESATWGNLAHRKLAEYAEPGRHELWVAKRASLDASMAMLDALGDRYESHLRGGCPASCGFLSGPNTALPHGVTENRRLERGDVLVTGATANVGGYVSELERTMFLGEVADGHREHFAHMREMQGIAIDAMGPGVAAADVDAAVHEYCAERGLLEYTQHHTGHNIGLEGHERGFLDRGSEEVLEPGQLYTVEPGLYVPGVAGYRHSDTVLVTEDGTESLTYFPKSIEENVIPV
ncbi:MAG: M24 family metallopeptidase [Halobacteriales archaeon]